MSRSPTVATLALGAGDDLRYRRVQVHAAGRPVEARVAEAEDAAVAGDQPVPLAGRRGGHADDRRVEVSGAERAEVRRVEGEEAAVVGDEPVALSVGGRGHA